MDTRHARRIGIATAALLLIGAFASPASAAAVSNTKKQGSNSGSQKAGSNSNTQKQASKPVAKPAPNPSTGNRATSGASATQKPAANDDNYKGGRTNTTPVGPNKATLNGTKATPAPAPKPGDNKNSTSSSAGCVLCLSPDSVWNQPKHDEECKIGASCIIYDEHKNPIGYLNADGQVLPMPKGFISAQIIKNQAKGSGLVLLNGDKILIVGGPNGPVLIERDADGNPKLRPWTHEDELAYDLPPAGPGEFQVQALVEPWEDTVEMPVIHIDINGELYRLIDGDQHYLTGPNAP